MAAYKCKMCGGNLMIEAGSSVCECEYCGSKQTVPNADNEKKLAMFGRAAKLLRECDFDRAANLFESIVAEFPEEAEAYWGLVLCQYGIEYVDDPATGKKVPTCHRSSFDSVMEDENLEKAMDYADGIARKQYRAEAIAIEELRKGILEVSGKEAPYDVFISYKETDDSGERTADSVIAQDIYRELTREGYRVFFSRVSLESKLGTEYEPYIFAALHSAKVMLVVGTEYDRFNAVWVKNEWSRFLKLIAAGQKKTLIPCFKDITAYDMPKEFAKLTAQDMGKIGAMQDLVHGVEKLISKQEAPKQEPVVVQQVASGPSAENLLERMFLYLEDGNWQEAKEYANKVLDIDSHSGEAYLGKLMVAHRLSKREQLGELTDLFDSSKDYEKIMRFGSDALKAEISGYEAAVKDRIYGEAQSMMDAAKTEMDFKNAAQGFKRITDWKDAEAKAAECLEQAEIARKNKLYDESCALMEAADTEAAFKKAADAFAKIPGWKDADTKAAECLTQAETIRNNKLYDEACALMEAAKTEEAYKNAAEAFAKIPGWKDADAKTAEMTVAKEHLETLRKQYDEKYGEISAIKANKQQRLYNEHGQATFEKAEFEQNKILTLGFGLGGFVLTLLYILLFAVGGLEGDDIVLGVMALIFSVSCTVVSGYKYVNHLMLMRTHEKTIKQLGIELEKLGEIPTFEEFCAMQENK